MKIIPFILLGMLILPEYIPIRKTDALPLLDNITTTAQEQRLQEQRLQEPHQSNVVTAVGGRTPPNVVTAVGGRTPPNVVATLRSHRSAKAEEYPPLGGGSPLVCDACMFIANGINETVLHNPKVIAFVTEDLEQICAVLPQSVQALCSAAANQTAPIILGHLGDFIATEGCADLGVCHGVV
jgi:hypothetical protein